MGDSRFHWVIAGGGTSGWMTAAAFAAKLDPSKFRITLVESDAIGTVGVGEATVPHLRFFNESLGINEHEFMRETQATYKLGIEFQNWGQLGDSYIHPFGTYGQPSDGIGFFQHWLKAKTLGNDQSLEHYAPGAVLAREGRFSYPGLGHHALDDKFSYAFHLDASRYAAYLRRYSERKGVTRTEGKIESVDRCPTSGDIRSITLNGGNTITANAFVDCTGFRAVLNGQTLGSKYIDWTHWLPCDRAVAIPSKGSNNPNPYTQAIAHQAGWRWKIPLQHRDGNGMVYCSQFMSPEQAEQQLRDSLDGESLAAANHLRFTTGVREATWSHNSIAIGLSAGFLEPLESTSIYLIQAAIMNLIECLPSDDPITNQLVRDQFNQRMTLEYERVRDFLILHYTATQRTDSAFWNMVGTIKRPPSLERKMALFLEQGQVEHYEHGMFLEPSWQAVYEGQNLLPASYHLAANRGNDQTLQRRLIELQTSIEHWAKAQPTHQQALTKLGAASPNDHWPPAALSLYGVFS